MAESLYKGFNQESRQNALVTATSTLTGSGNRRIEVNTSGGAVTLTLPNACEAAWSMISVFKTGGGSNAVTIAVKSGESTLKQVGTTALATMEDDSDRAVFLSDGASWHCISQILGD